MGVTLRGDYAALMRPYNASAHGHSSPRVLPQTARLPVPAASSSASDTKADNIDNASDITSEQGEITRDLCHTHDADFASAAAPAPVSPTPSSAPRDPANPIETSSFLSPCPVPEVRVDTGNILADGNVPTATVSVPSSSSSREPDPAGGTHLPARTDSGSLRPPTFLRARHFPQGQDGKCLRWRSLRDDHPPLAMLGTPARSVLAEQGHTGQLQRAKPFDGVWKKYPLTPAELALQALQDQREKLARDRKARFNSGGFGERAAKFRKRTAELKAAILKARGAQEPVAGPRIGPLPREEFQARVAVWKVAAVKLKADLLARGARSGGAS
ncbi:hypothetical protein L873DRAFT_1823176 [Choiromyces venosus 120613-1]|uniref:Uncharacterized protein n=1 Tax=Choiromyces venosus 120613-1 TaxID=1336337 RepID=A0A3N4J5Z8_9PEZI|nr:hypothetical protein L873DRAFT_1823176 [Choiromyces venosus 120613-1]